MHQLSPLSYNYLTFTVHHLEAQKEHFMGAHKDIVFILAFQKISLPLHSGCSNAHTSKSHKIVKMQSQHCLFTMGDPTPFILSFLTVL